MRQPSVPRRPPRRRTFGGIYRTASNCQKRLLPAEDPDVYYIHRFDDQTPAEETMATLHDLVRAGKVRYLGASSMWAWQFAKM